MDFSRYAETAVSLVNTDFGTTVDLQSLLTGRSWLRERVAREDLRALRPVSAELSRVVDASARGDADEVVDRINALLARHPVHPRISGHDESSWHLHVSDTEAGVAEIIVAEALFGLTLLVTEMGATRLGRCAAEGCDRAFLDTSTNRTRRFCSARCATRTNVANYRNRRRGTSGRPSD